MPEISAIGWLLSVMGGADMDLLKRVSRSFYLSIRLLPAPMRGGVAAGYLLARTSDTVADASNLPVDERMRILDALLAGLSGAPWSHLGAIESGLVHVGERDLVRGFPEWIGTFERLPEGERRLVVEVVATIISGQKLDLDRFGKATVDAPVALTTRNELEDYTYRVAGCVGEFWTRLGFLTLGDRFSIGDPDLLQQTGRRYGMGLQLVNILRDLHADLRMGRCYLPVMDPLDRSQVLGQFRAWLPIAREWSASGLAYSRELRLRRLRVASRLPAALGVRTIDLLATADQASLERGVKVPRRTVYAELWRGLFR